MNTYIKTFIDYLTNEEKITEQEFKDNYRYCGSNNSHYIKKMCPNIEHIPNNTKCICGHEISDNYYFTDIRIPKEKRQKLIILGSKCKNRYIEKNQRLKKCELCDKPHKNIKDNYCNNCRINIKNKEKEEKKQVNENEKILKYTIDFGKHHGKKPHKLPKDYLSWVLSKKSDKYLNFDKKNKVKQYMKIYDKKNNKDIDFID